MKRIDASPQGIYEVSWSPDGKWLTYVADENEVRLAEAASGERRVIGPGSCPSVTRDGAVVLERDDTIHLITTAGSSALVTPKDIFKESPKRNPLVSPDGKQLLFTVCDVFDKDSQSKNAYPHRHFIGLCPLKGGKPTLTSEQWYGGTAIWFPDSRHFAHFEFDSTGGAQVHIVSLKGEREGTVAGLYPSISPDGMRLAVKPRGGGSVVIYSTKGGWSNAEVETTALRIPDGAGQRASGTPPIWTDNRFVIVDDGGRLFRLDTKRDKAEEMKKLPQPTDRRKHSMIASPDRSQVAIEVEAEDGGGYELRLYPLS